MRPRVFVSHADTYSGYYTAREMLREDQFDLVRIGVRNPSSVKELTDRGAEAVQLYSPDAHELEHALRGIQSLFIVPPPSSSCLQDVRAYIDAAVRTGVKSVVLLSIMRGSSDDDNDDNKNKKRRDGGKDKKKHDDGDDDRSRLHLFDAMESYLKESGLRWCILRTGFVQQNLLYFAEIIQNKGMIPLPIGHGKFSPVNLKDVAVAASIILRTHPLRDEDLHQVYTLTGTEAPIDGPGLAIIASRVLLAPISFHDITPDQMRRILRAVRGITEWEVELYMDMFADIRHGVLDVQSRDLARLIGSQGETVEEFFGENADQLRPGQGPAA
ncbi:hypothetical protein RI367_004909 [Sorochytrium milnesiophthora]